MYNKKLAGSLLVTLISFVNCAFADDVSISSISAIPRLNSLIDIDGHMTDGEWQGALQISLDYEIDPGENTVASQRTTAYLIENGDFLYVAFKALDSEPEKIRAYLSPRDELWESDYVSIALDTFNDSRRAYQFSTNAIGVQADSIIDEINGNDDIGWDSIWTSAGQVNTNGFSVEMAIPLKSLRFVDSDQIKDWKIKLSRVWIRDVKHEFSNVLIDRNQECNLCQFANVKGFKDTKSASNLTVIPAVTLNQSMARDIDNGGGWHGSSIEERGSLDIRWGMNQNVFVNATINPDFSHVEADDLQLQGNERFALRSSEKRAFFQDGSDYFSNWSSLVYTKLFSEPEYGVKLTGKSGEHSYGFISLKDKDTNFLLGDNQSSKTISLEGESSDNQILRYRYDLGEQGNLGFTYTHRDGNEYSNKMLSLDGKYWFGESDYFKFQVMNSDTLNPLYLQQAHNLDSEQTGNAYSINYTHSTRNWDVLLTHHNFGKGFRADAGFVSRNNWKTSALEVARNWYSEERNAWWKSISFDLQLNFISDLDGNRLNRSKGIGAVVNGVYQSSLGFVYYSDQQNFVAQHSENSIPEEIEAILIQTDYDVDTYEIYADFSPFAGLDVSLSYYWGDEVDFFSANLGESKNLISIVGYQLNENLKFTLERSSQSFDVVGDTDFEEKLYNFKTSYQIDTNHSLRFTLQKYRLDDYRNLASQLLYAYEINPFTLFYFGYSDNFRNNEKNRLQRTDKTLFMKFSYAWQL